MYKSIIFFKGVGTRFVASVEAGATKMHKDLILSAGFDDVARTIIFTGRPMRVRKTPYVADWYDSRSVAHAYHMTDFICRENKQAEIHELTSKGIIPVEHDLKQHPEKSISAR